LQVKVLDETAVDMTGLGRAMVLNLQLPMAWSSESADDPKFL
jgi:2,4-dienoyl-CoA reductase-like NADH-dependent reductase (Old Yellow Enzyme family)